MPSMPDAMVLCGGAGTRLRSVTGSLPKVMASVAGRPFLELLLRQLKRHNVERVILAVGYQREVIQTHFGEQWEGLRLVYAVETSPLGTGGALCNAAGLVESDSVLVVNGDSYTDTDLAALVADHRESKADFSLVLVPTDGRADCGVVKVDGKGRVERFDEKISPSGSQYVNAGIYVVKRTLLEEISPEGAVSLEKELFPLWLGRGKYIHSYVFRGQCVDIGTPERFQKAQRTLANIEAGKGTRQGESSL